MSPLIAIALAMLSVDPPSPETILESFEAPKYGLKTAIPRSWEVVESEKDDRIFVAMIPQDNPDRPGVVACELGLAPESLEDYRSRIEANAKRGNRPGASLTKNEIARTSKGEQLESIWEFQTAGGTLWREVTVRRLANRQMYIFILNVDEPTYAKARPLFDSLVDTTVLSPPNTGADLLDKGSNTWVQREFRFSVLLPESWSPVLAPSSVALLFANAPASGIWSDNFLVLAKPFEKVDLQELAKTLPEQLQNEQPGCEVIACKVIRQRGRDALETIVRTKQGPFSMTVIERRFRGDRFDYEVKFTTETKRFEALTPALLKSLDSFQELPGNVPSAPPRKAA